MQRFALQCFLMIAAVVVLGGCTADAQSIATLLRKIEVQQSSSTPSQATSTEATHALTPLTEEEIAQGVAAYRDAYCGVCHTLTIAGTRGEFAPNQDGMGLLAEMRLLDPAYTGNATTAADFIRESILDPTAFVEGAYQITHHPMPPFTHLPSEQVESIVQLLLHQREESAVPVP
ncbi:hypothetical protein GC175_29060 [bacterium]|nr:hypothetical protein [bacterium]